MKHAFLISLVGLGLAGCSLVPQGSHDRQARADREPAPVSQGAVAPRAGSSMVIAPRAVDAQCFAALGQSGARFDALPDQYLGQGCSTLGAVQMHALRSDSGQLGVTNLGPVTCPVSSAFAAWARFGVDRAARQIFGVPLARIETMGSYSCRNVAGTARRSGHATATAIDVSGFELADGRRIGVLSGWNGTDKESEFLRTVQRSACRRFGTVLGPDYNSAHRDHLHLEGVIEGNSFCR